MKRYICSICGYIYDDKNEKVNFEDLPDNWKCPLCGAPKSAFNEVKSDNKINTDNKINVEVQSEEKSNSKKDADKPTKSSNEIEDIKELSFGELSAICSNLAKGCEKQYLFEESGLFTELADYYKNKVKTSEDVSFDKLIEMINGNLNNEMSVADGEAERYSDRGAKRVLTWSRKVTTILKSLLERYQSEGSLFIEKTNVYVCSICGFIYIGEEAPEVCPICKVPKLKFIKVGRNI